MKKPAQHKSSFARKHDSIILHFQKKKKKQQINE